MAYNGIKEVAFSELPNEFFDYMDNTNDIGTEYSQTLFSLGFNHALKSISEKKKNDWVNFTKLLKSEQPLNLKFLHGARAMIAKGTTKIDVLLLLSGNVSQSSSPYTWQGGLGTDPDIQKIFIDSWYGRRGWTLFLDKSVDVYATAESMRLGERALLKDSETGEVRAFTKLSENTIISGDDDYRLHDLRPWKVVKSFGIFTTAEAERLTNQNGNEDA